MRCLGCIACAASLYGVSTAHAAPDYEILRINTFDFRQNRQIRLPNELYLPSGSHKVPGMVLVHGSGGVTDYRERRYARILRQMGIAALVIDAFRARGIRRTINDQSRISSLQMTVDAFHAADELGRRNRVIKTKIGIVGFSKGGTATLYSSTRRYLRIAMKHLPSARPFALHVAFYPWCGNFWRDTTMNGAPVVVLIGGQDTYSGVKPCLEWVRRHRLQGGNVRSIVYPTARHAWDGLISWRFPSGENHSRCIFEQRSDGSRRERTSGVQFVNSNGVWDRKAYRLAISKCRRYGVSGGIHAASKSASMRDFRQLVRRFLLGR